MDLNAAEINQQGLDVLGVPQSPVASYQGDGVRVAVLDTGVDMASDDLTVAVTADFTGGGTVKDGNGHGTKISGIISARKNGIGLVGIAPRAVLLVGKVANDDGYVKAKDLVAGIDWAIAQHADIINISLEMHRTNGSGLRAAIQRAAGRNILVVCSAGNTTSAILPSRVTLPARYPESISVGMLGTTGTMSDFSFKNPRIDVYAPGEEIVATYPGNKLTIESGGSFATAWASGYAARLIQMHRLAGEPYDRQVIVSEMKKNLDGLVDTPMYDPWVLVTSFGVMTLFTLLISILVTWLLLKLKPVQRIGWMKVLPLAFAAVLLLRWAQAVLTR